VLTILVRKSRGGDVYVFLEVEDPSERRINGSPSWVPDFSVEKAHPSLGMSTLFNVFCKHNLKHHRPEVHGTDLVLFARRLDHVRETGNSSWNWKEIPLILLQVVAHLDPIYSQTGESRLQALQRTLVSNPAGTTSVRAHTGRKRIFTRVSLIASQLH
jgi:hypothetical protein